MLLIYVEKRATNGVSLEASFCMELKPLTSLHVLVSIRNKGYPNATIRFTVATTEGFKKLNEGDNPHKMATASIWMQINGIC